MKRLNLLFALTVSLFGFKSFAEELVFESSIRPSGIDLDKYIEGNEINLSELTSDIRFNNGSFIRLNNGKDGELFLIKDEQGNIRMRLNEYARPLANGQGND